MTSVSDQFKSLQAKKAAAEREANAKHKEKKHNAYLNQVSNMIENMLDGFDEKITTAFNKAAENAVVYEPTLRAETNLGFWSGHSEECDVQKFAELPAFQKLKEECAARGIAYEFNKERARDEADELSMYLKLTIHLSKTQAEAESNPKYGAFFKFQ